MTTVATDCADNRPGLRARQRLLREQAILDAAFALIADSGYEAMTMEALADRVGLSKPTLYNHFPSKEAIAVRALVRLNEQAVDAIESIDSSLEPVERLDRFVRWLVRIRFEAPSSAFLRARAALTPARTHPDYLAAAARKHAAVVRLIGDAQRAGSLDAAMPADLLAHALFALVCHSEYDDLVADGAVSSADAGRALMRLFLSGARS